VYVYLLNKARMSFSSNYDDVLFMIVDSILDTAKQSLKEKTPEDT
jgi:hypothetical protein